MWFQKKEEHTIYADERCVDLTCSDGKRWVVDPDVQMDFTNMPFEDNQFKLVVFDPPHLKKLGQNSIMAQKYGVLKYHWRDDIRDGLAECFRVLEPGGVLIFKWNENQIPIKEVLALCPVDPLFGHTNGKRGHTIWMTFMKIPGAATTSAHCG
jgi:ubiquinone/menaquinone biosynthesis C-methylase UbiE